MAKRSVAFAELLTEAIYQIRSREQKTIGIIQDELGFSLQRRGGSMIEYWRKGFVPGKVSDIETLAREIIRRGQFDLLWLEKFLTAAYHPWPQALCDELFPQPQADSPATHENQTETPQEATDLKFDELPTEYIPSPAPLPSGSLVPWSKNPLFVGRRSDLRTLATSFKPESTLSSSQVETTVLTGLGGIGKTQLASEFVHRYGQFFDGGIYWMSFEHPEAILAEIAACGNVGALELRPDFSTYPLDDQVKLVQAAWQSTIPRLLVFDNCEDPQLLAHWRPTSGGCRVLVTSRRGDWEPALGVQTIALGVLSRSESIALLSKHCPHISQQLLDEIADELGDLPLALHLAGRYMRYFERSLDPVDYLAQLRDPLLLHHPSMQQEGISISPTGHVQHVGRTFALSYDRLSGADEIDLLARKLLVHAAHFAPGEPIWYELLVKTLPQDGGKTAVAMRANRAFQRLIDIGLIETKGRDIVRMHRLVAKFVRDVAIDEVEATQKAVEAVIFEETKHLNKAVQPLPLLARQLHLRSVVDVARAREDVESARLCYELGLHLWQVSDFGGARPYHEKALEIRLKLQGENHPETAESLIAIGRVLRGLGQDADSQPYFERALAIREVLFGKYHVDTAECYENIGRCLHALGHPEQGIAYIRTALDIIQAVVGLNNERAAECHNNIAYCFFSMKRYEEALVEINSALTINESVLGSAHPHTALSHHNLGTLLLRLNRYAEAEPHLEQALAIRRQVYGSEHKDTAITMDAVANLYRHLGQLPLAKQLAKEALDKFNSILGRNHVRTSYGHRTLGLILKDEGSLAEARIQLQKAYDIRLASRGESHFLTQEVQADLAALPND